MKLNLNDCNYERKLILGVIFFLMRFNFKYVYDFENLGFDFLYKKKLMVLNLRVKFLKMFLVI